MLVSANILLLFKLVEKVSVATALEQAFKVLRALRM
jgi:hypothetical protein